ncbi:MAG: nucleoside deaminase [Clostridia bacterium]|nr:nucleoside deaminase [Clostridia bacterium]
MTDYYHDLPFMEAALAQARLAFEAGEVPVGAVIVQDGKIIATGHNRREQDRNALAHAECEAIAAACKAVGDWRLTGCTLYVTLEPCPMCAGAIVNARIDRVVYGAADQRAGCVGSRIHLFALDFECVPKVTHGVMAEQCSQLLSDFFANQRNSEKKN